MHNVTSLLTAKYVCWTLYPSLPHISRLYLSNEWENTKKAQTNYKLTNLHISESKKLQCLTFLLDEQHKQIT